MKQTIARWLLIWVFGNLGMVVLTFARILGWTGLVGVRVRGFRWLSPRERKKVFPVLREGLVIYYRHIGLLEALIVPFALYPLWLMGERFVPRSLIADYWLRCLPILGPACIPLSKDQKTKRGAVTETLAALRRAENDLDQGRIVCIAPTGTRQHHVTRFKVISRGKIGKADLTWPSDYQTLRHAYELLRCQYDDHLIGAFQGGAGWLALHTNAWFLPVWVSKNHWLIKVTYGEPFKLPGGILNPKKATMYLERKLLELGEGL